VNGKISQYICILFFILSSAVPCLAKYSGGTGEPNTPYLISSPNDLNSIGLDANDWDKHFKMISDIDMSGYTGTQFNIIGNLSDQFTGVFDGNGHTVGNFTYVTSSTEKAGLFGQILSGVIKNMNMSSMDVNTPNGRFVGGLVARAEEMTMQNCSIDGFVVGEYSVGSLVGLMQSGTMQDCHSRCDVSGEDNVGGLAGLIGNGVILQCSSTSNTVAGTGGVGGIAGNNNGDILKCYTTSEVSGGGWAIGGIAGCHSNGGLIRDCYSGGVVEGGSRCGGIAGSMELAGIENCYSAGYVSGLEYIGGILGMEDYGSFYIACFWDMEIIPDVNGIGNGSDPNVIGLPKAEMQQRSTFTDAGWDFVGETVNGANDVWDICEGTNYPKFVWQILPADLICPDGVDFIDYSYLANRWQLEKLEQDYNSDGRVNFNDWALLADDWDGQSYTEPVLFIGRWLALSVGRADIAPPGGDGFVDWQDLLIFAQHWLEVI